VSESTACLSAAERTRLLDWLARPNGSLRLSLAVFEAVEGGGVMVRIRAADDPPPAALLFPTSAVRGDGFTSGVISDMPDDARFSSHGQRILWRCLHDHPSASPARECAREEIQRRGGSD